MQKLCKFQSSDGVIVGRVGRIPSDGIRLDGYRLFLIILVERWFLYWIISIMRFLEEYRLFFIHIRNIFKTIQRLTLNEIGSLVIHFGEGNNESE